MSDVKAAADRIMEALEGKPELLAEIKRRLAPPDALAPAPSRRIVYCQDWEESERGWGTRPDGHTLHLTKADHAAFVAGYYQTFNNQPTAPDEYTRTCGELRRVEVPESDYQELVAMQNKPVGDAIGALAHDWMRHGFWGHSRNPGPPAYEED